MTDKRIRALIVGGDRRNLTDHVLEWVDATHVEQHDKRIPAGSAHDAQVVVVITRWVSRSLWDAAKKFAKQKDLRVLQAQTGNYIVHELVKSGLLPKEAEERKKKAEKPVPAVSAPVPEARIVKVSTGLSPEEIWEKYGDKAIEVLKATVKPGEKVHEDDVFALFATEGGVGLPKEDARHLLPELSIRGVLVNTKGQTWMFPRLDVDYDESGERADGTLEDAGKDAEVQPVLSDAPTVKPVRPGVYRGGKVHGFPKEHWIGLLRGLPGGLYPCGKTLWERALEFEEFSHQNGTPLAWSYYWQILPTAIKKKIIEKKGKRRLFLHHDPSVVLTKRGTKPEAEGRGPTDIEKKSAGSPEGDSAMKPPSPAPVKEESNPVEAVRKHFGGMIPVLDRYTTPIGFLKRVLPAKNWDELAARTVAKIAGVKDWSTALYLKAAFDVAEWSRLAYETLKGLPVEVLAPHLKDVSQDFDLTCVDCGAKFIFTVSEQVYFQKMVDEGKFEEYVIPRRCRDCRGKLRPKGAGL